MMLPRSGSQAARRDQTYLTDAAWRFLSLTENSASARATFSDTRSCLEPLSSPQSEDEAVLEATSGRLGELEIEIIEGTVVGVIRLPRHSVIDEEIRHLLVSGE